MLKKIDGLDLFLLRIATCFAAVCPDVEVAGCSTACAQIVRGSSRFEVLETASRLSVVTANTEENVKNMETYLSDLESVRYSLSDILFLLRIHCQEHLG